MLSYINVFLVRLSSNLGSNLNYEKDVCTTIGVSQVRIQEMPRVLMNMIGLKVFKVYIYIGLMQKIMYIIST